MHEREARLTEEPKALAAEELKQVSHRASSYVDDMTKNLIELTEKRSREGIKRHIEKLKDMNPK